MIQGLILAFGAGIFLFMSGVLVGETSIITNLKSAMLVLGGSLLSATLSYSYKNILELLRSVWQILFKAGIDFEALVEQIEKLAYINRRNGSKAVEEEAKKLNNPFLNKGIEMVVDRYDRYEIRNVLEQEIELFYSRKESQHGILTTLTKLSPALGFVGTIVGLVNVLSNLGQPDEIGQGMAMALLTTFYGLLFSNFLFLPLSKKLAEHHKAEATALNLILEGMIDIAEGKNSRAIGHRLRSFLVMHDLARPRRKAQAKRVKTLPKPKAITRKKVVEHPHA